MINAASGPWFSFPLLPIETMPMGEAKRFFSGMRTPPRSAAANRDVAAMHRALHPGGVGRHLAQRAGAQAALAQFARYSRRVDGPRRAAQKRLRFGHALYIRGERRVECFAGTSSRREIAQRLGHRAREKRGR